jgi:hypothetical protein
VDIRHVLHRTRPAVATGTSPNGSALAHNRNRPRQPSVIRSKASHHGAGASNREGIGAPIPESRTRPAPILRVSRHLGERREALRCRMRNGVGLQMAPGRLHALGYPNSRRMRLQGRAERGQKIRRKQPA